LLKQKQGSLAQKPNSSAVKTWISFEQLCIARPVKWLLRLVPPLVLIIAVPAWLGAQSAITPVIDPKTGVVHSSTLLSGMPLGGIGTGKVEILTDGSFAHATIMNNQDRPTGPLPGCFAAIWTRAGTQTSARVLALNSPYGLPTVTRLDFDGLAPQAQLTYPDPALPFAVNLLAFSPLTPFVIKDSGYPAAALVFRLKNTLPVPVEVSVVISWEGLLGVGSDGRGGPFHDRNGVQVATIPSAEGYFGLRFSSPPLPASSDNADRQHANAGGEMVLMAYPSRPQTTVTTAGWNALDAKPGWWEQFSKSGDVSGGVGTGQEGRVHPAAALAVRLMLKPNDYVELPFAVAWYAPHHWLPDSMGRFTQDVGHFYQNLYDDADQAARRLLDQWPSLYALTEEWQKRLTYSNLPRWLARRFVNTVAPLTADSVYTRDGRFALAPGVAALPEGVPPGAPDPNFVAQSDTRQHLAVCALLLSLFPQLQAQFLMQCATTEVACGAMPPLTSNDLSAVLGPPVPDPTSPAGGPVVSAPRIAPIIPPDLMAAPIDSNSAYVLEAAQYALWTGDLTLLQSIFPAVRGALAALLQARDGKALPTFAGLPTPRPGSITLYLAALKAGQRLAELLNDTQLATDCRTAAARGIDGLEKDYWNGDCYGTPKQDAGTHPLCDVDQLLGEWATDQLGLEPLLPTAHVTKTLASLQAQANITAEPDGTTLPAWEPLANTLGVVALTLRQPMQAEAGIALLHRLDDRRNNRIRTPWITPQRLPESGATSSALASDLGGTADWNLLYTLEGFAYDAVAGRMTLLPNLPGTWRTYSAPVFAPTFWANLEYKPTAHGGLINFRLDRLLSVGTEETSKHRKFVRAELTLRSLRVPGPPTLPAGTADTPRTAYVSVGLRPIGFRTETDAAGNLTLTFDTPLALVAGDRLQIDVH
jgi:non-lysosomal glucosylceramidase